MIALFIQRSCYCVHPLCTDTALDCLASQHQWALAIWHRSQRKSSATTLIPCATVQLETLPWPRYGSLAPSTITTNHLKHVIVPKWGIYHFTKQLLEMMAWKYSYGLLETYWGLFPHVGEPARCDLCSSRHPERSRRRRAHRLTWHHCRASGPATRHGKVWGNTFYIHNQPSARWSDMFLWTHRYTIDI